MVQLISVLRMAQVSWVLLLLAGCLRKEPWKPVLDSEEVPGLLYVPRLPCVSMPQKTFEVDYNERLTGKLLSYCYHQAKLYLLSRKKIVRISVTERNGISIISKDNHLGFTRIKSLGDSVVLFGDTAAVVVSANLNLDQAKRIEERDKIIEVFYINGRICVITASGAMTAYTEDLQTRLWETMSYNEYSTKKPYIYPIKNQIFFLKNPDKLLSIDIDSGNITKVENIWSDNPIDIHIAAGPKNLYISNGKYLFIKTNKEVFNYVLPNILKIFTKEDTIVLETPDEFLISNTQEIEMGRFFGRILKQYDYNSIVITRNFIYMGDPAGVSIFDYAGKLVSRILAKKPILFDLEGSAGIMTNDRFSVYT